MRTFSASHTTCSSPCSPSLHEVRQGQLISRAPQRTQDGEVTCSSDCDEAKFRGLLSSVGNFGLSLTRAMLSQCGTAQLCTKNRTPMQMADCPISSSRKGGTRKTQDCIIRIIASRPAALALPSQVLTDIRSQTAKVICA